MDVETQENDILEKVKAFADQAHNNQKRKYTNERYIVHPVRVMDIVHEYNQELPVLAAALLHDVIEDTPVGKREMGNFLGSIMEKNAALRTLELVEELTDVFVKTDYPSLHRRSRKNREVERLSMSSPEAQTIKYADIIDNVGDIVKQDNDFALVYLRECKQMLQALDKGDPKLYQLALQTVDQLMREFWNNANVKAL
jgi:guanosine-3',5'-bis(diphosphate) 3'-pyrophosphohydrolase